MPICGSLIRDRGGDRERPSFARAISWACEPVNAPAARFGERPSAETVAAPAARFREGWVSRSPARRRRSRIPAAGGSRSRSPPQAVHDHEIRRRRFTTTRSAAGGSRSRSRPRSPSRARPLRGWQGARRGAGRGGQRRCPRSAGSLDRGCDFLPVGGYGSQARERSNGSKQPMAFQALELSIELIDVLRPVSRSTSAKRKCPTPVTARRGCLRLRAARTKLWAAPPVRRRGAPLLARAKEFLPHEHATPRGYRLACAFDTPAGSLESRRSSCQRRALRAGVALIAATSSKRHHSFTRLTSCAVRAATSELSLIGWFKWLG